MTDYANRGTEWFICMMEVDMRKFLKNLVAGNSWGYNLTNLIRPGCEKLEITGLALNVRPSGKRLPVSDRSS